MVYCSTAKVPPPSCPLFLHERNAFSSRDSNADLLACLLAIDYDAQYLASMTTTALPAELVQWFFKYFISPLGKFNFFILIIRYEIALTIECTPCMFSKKREHLNVNCC